MNQPTPHIDIIAVIKSECSRSVLDKLRDAMDSDPERPGYPRLMTDAEFRNNLEANILMGFTDICEGFGVDPFADEFPEPSLN